ncbi:hypothetical protein OG589_14655 [Sphaerisporangium sp. NBC_01403]|uniref:hypothetical protein n=1 Tax=Sphaerisporangium sp. NBC_01403 TaxID=2903599 RepID=UPI0032457D14
MAVLRAHEIGRRDLHKAADRAAAYAEEQRQRAEQAEAEVTRLDAELGAVRTQHTAARMALKGAEREAEALRAQLTAARAATGDSPAISAWSKVFDRAQCAEAAVARVREALDFCGRIMATSSRDWGDQSVDALLWAVIVGWVCEELHVHDWECGADLSLLAMAERHGWDDALVERLRLMRDAVRAVLDVPADGEQSGDRDV